MIIWRISRFEVIWSGASQNLWRWLAPDHERQFYNGRPLWPYNSININKLLANTFFDPFSTTDTWSSIGSLVMSSFTLSLRLRDDGLALQDSSILFLLIVDLWGNPSHFTWDFEKQSHRLHVMLTLVFPSIHDNGYLLHTISVTLCQFRFRPCIITAFLFILLKDECKTLSSIFSMKSNLFKVLLPPYAR